MVTQTTQALPDGRPYSMKDVLNQRESQGLEYACDLYQQRFGRPPQDDPDLFIHLGDNPRKFLCWSAVSGRMPTFRTGSGFFYNPFKDCWLLPKDKLACLGFPVTPEISAAMSVPTVPIADHFHAASIAGNSFHFSTVAVVQMVALACYRIKA